MRYSYGKHIRQRNAMPSHFGREERHGGTEERIRDRRLVTGVMSGWGGASRSMRTKYHIFEQFVVEFGRTLVPVNTSALLGEASRDTLELASQALSTSNDIAFNFLLISLSKLRTLDPAFSHMQSDQANNVW